MIVHESVLVAPTAEQLLAGLHAAQQALAAVQHRRRAVGWPLPDEAGFLRCYGAEPEGRHVWSGGRGDLPGECPFLHAVWASDWAGRRHVRVVAGQVEASTTTPTAGVLGTESEQPPAWGVFREHACLCHGDGDPEVVFLCRCGAIGTLREIAWMGAWCGPCHDRAASGEPTPDGLPDFGIGTLRGLVGRTGRVVQPLHLDRRLRRVLVGQDDGLFVHHPGERAASALGEGLLGAALSPGGERALLLAREPARLCVWDCQAEAFEAEIATGVPAAWATFAPDGRAFAAAVQADSAASVLVWSGPRQPVPIRRFALDSYVHGLAFGAAGRRLYAGTVREVLELDLAGDRQPRPIDVGGQVVRCLAASADGRWLACLSAQTTLRLHDLATGRTRSAPLWTPPDKASSGLQWHPAPAFAPDGGSLAVQDTRGRLRFYSAPGLELLGTFSWLPEGAEVLSCSAGDEWLATTAAGRRLRFWPRRLFLDYARRRHTAGSRSPSTSAYNEGE